MSFWESFVTAWQSLTANKLRSALTILGIVIGVSAVVFLVSFGRGHEANITAVFESMGADTIYITSTTDIMHGMSGATESLTLEDAEALGDPNRAPSIASVAPIIEKMAGVIHKNEKSTVDIMGITPEIRYIISYPLASGVFISEDDVRSGASVAVLGNKAASDLFGTNDPLEESIRISGRYFEVIGVLEAKGGFIATADNFIMIPLTTMQAKILGETSPQGRPVQSIGFRAISTKQVDSAKEEAISILRQRHHIREGKDNDFNIIDMREILNQMKQVLDIFQVFLSSVGAISLVVGGIGIMNIMLVSVAERTREIGIRKTVGAKRRDIMRQFLVESAALSLSGGVIGIILAFIGIILATQVDIGDYAIKAPISPDIIIIALSVAIVTGLISGLYPAFRAASTEIVESLRQG